MEALKVVVRSHQKMGHPCGVTLYYVVYRNVVYRDLDLAPATNLLAH